MAAVTVRPVGSSWLRTTEPLHCYKLKGATLTPISVCLTPKFQSLCTKSQSPENPCRKSNSGGGFPASSSGFNVLSAGEVIKRYVDNGNCKDAILVYVKLLELGLPVAEEFQFFPILIKAFGGFCNVSKAREIHGHVLKLGVLGDVYNVNSILGVYWKCGAVEDAVHMFERMSERDLVSWNTMISGFCHLGDYVKCLGVFSQMVRGHGVLPNRVACLSALSSCSSVKDLVCGREVHGFVVKRWLDGDQFMVGGLVDMYMKCGDVKNAECVYRSVVDDEGVRGNTVIWNVMISGYVSNECWLQAVELFLEMLAIGLLPDTSTIVAVIGLCSQLMDLAFGKQIHKFCLSTRLNTDVRVETALMDMYFKCGDSTTALEIFRMSRNRDLVMWSSAISSCAQSNYPHKALNLFHDYISEYGFVDSVIVLAILRASASLAVKSIGMEIHGLVVKMGFDSDVFVASAIVDYYAKCRDVESSI